MKLNKNSLLLYAVTDRAWTGEKTLLQQVSEAIQGGVTMLQLREKDLDETEFFKEAEKMRDLCKTSGVAFIINDNVDIAVNCGADGVHIGQSDGDVASVRKKIGQSMILGVSAQTVKQAIEAEKCGADYLGVGAMFSTKTKPDADDVSIETLKEICASVKIPVVAIGGITKTNMSKLCGSGISGVALVSAIFAQNDIKSECKELLALSKEVCTK